MITGMISPVPGPFHCVAYAATPKKAPAPARLGMICVKDPRRARHAGPHSVRSEQRLISRARTPNSLSLVINV